MTLGAAMFLVMLTLQKNPEHAKPRTAASTGAPASVPAKKSFVGGDAISQIGASETIFPQAGTDDLEVLVRRVLDGDTIALNDGQLVRYIGIDAPEAGKHLPLGCFAAEATERNRVLVEGKPVRLEKDISETDKYGRILRYVYVGDMFVNEVLVHEGYASAYPYPPDVKHQETFRTAERKARENQRGLWGSACIEAQRTAPFRSVSSPALNLSPLTADRDCSDFLNRTEAQKFFKSQGGPAADQHKLDQDGDGIACESLPLP